MKNFAAIDFETANHNRSSVCSVGVVLCLNGKIVKHYHSFIKPKPNFFTQRCIDVHHITADDVKLAPTFDQVWNDIAPVIEGLPLVAHNAAFDSGCLKAAFESYNMPYPDYEFYCTCKAARRALPELPNHKLNTLCDYFNIELNHHEALSDAYACAYLAQKLL